MGHHCVHPRLPGAIKAQSSFHTLHPRGKSQESAEPVGAGLCAAASGKSHRVTCACLRLV